MNTPPEAPSFLRLLQSIRSGRAHSDPGSFYQYDTSLSFDTNLFSVEFGVEEQGEDYHFILPKDLKIEERSSISTLIMNNMIVIPNSIGYKLPHEMTMFSFCGSYGDISFSHLNGHGFDPHDLDHLTPDLICVSDHVNVFELKTRNTSSRLSHDALKKIIQRTNYAEILTEKVTTSSPPTYMNYLFVTRNKVYSNFQISDESLKSICEGYSIGLSMQEALIRNGLLEEDDNIIDGMKLPQTVPDKVYDYDVNPCDALWSKMIGKGTIHSNVYNKYKPLFKSCIFRSKRELETKRNELSSTEKYKVKSSESSFMEEHSGQDKIVIDKRVLGFPLMLPMEKMSRCEGGHELSNFVQFSESKWRSLQSNESKVEIKELDFMDSRELEKSNLFEKESKMYRKHHKQSMRIKMDPDHIPDEMIMKGFGTRSKLEEEEVEKFDSRMRRGLSYMSPTNKVEDLLKFFDDSLEPCEVHKEFDDVLDYSLSDFARSKVPNIPGCNPSDDFKEFQKTRLGRSLTILNEIAIEANNNMKTGLKKNEYLIKKLRTVDAFLMMRPTNTRSFISCVLISDSKNFLSGNGLQDVVNCGSRSVSKPFSFTKDKLSTLVSILPDAFSTLCVCKKVFPVQYKKIFSLSLLIRLEDKHPTSQTLLLTRHVLMKSFIQKSKAVQDPMQVSVKFPKEVRSSLCLYIIKQMYSFTLKNVGSARLSNERPEGDKSGDLVVNCTGFRGIGIKNFRQALFMMYLGVYKNKDEDHGVHDIMKLYNKIIKQEVLLDTETREEMTGKVAWNIKKHGFPKAHEFDPELILASSLRTRKKIESRYGSMDRFFKIALAKEFSNNTFNDLATFKASAIFKSDPMFYKESLKPSNQKAIKAVFDLISTSDMGINPFSDMTQMVDKITKQGIYATVFSKLQLGGAREIFVLSMVSRICVLYVEILSRAICRELKNEMMVKGKRKYKVPQDFKKEIAKMREELADSDIKLTTMEDSFDNETWCQKFMMRTFACMLYPIYGDSKFWPTAKTILNEVSHKKIIVHRSLLDLFLKNKDIRSTKDPLNWLKDSFYGKPVVVDGVEIKPLVSQGCQQLKNRSNMMQGILHYSSGALGAMVSLYIDEMVTRFSQDQGITVRATNPVSSDDGGTIRVAFYKPGEYHKALTILKSCSKFRVMIAPFFCTKISTVKSSMERTDSIFEFNSTWFMWNTILSPVNKFVAACFRASTSENFKDRFVQCCNVRSQLKENGGDFQLSAQVQYAQSIFHYFSQGMLTDSLWPNTREIIRSKCHDSLGFFPFEPEPICGMLGARFARYLAFKSILENKETTSRIWSLTDDLGGSFHFRLGSVRRWYDMKKQLGANRDDVLEYFKQNPEKLFERPSDKLHLMMELKLRSITPGAMDSFKFYRVSDIFATSTYTSWSRCFTVYKTEGTVFKVAKCSFPELSKYIEGLPKFPVDNTIFPEHEVFNRFHDLSSNLQSTHVKTPITRNHLITIHLNTLDTKTPYPASETMKRLWFDKEDMRKNSRLRISYEDLSRQFPFLKLNFEESLKESSMDCLQMKNFLTSISDKSRSVTVLSPAKKSSTLTRFMYNLMETFTSLGEYYVTKGEDELQLESKVEWPELTSTPVIGDRRDIDNKLSSAETQLWMIRHSWLTEEEKRDLSFQLIKKLEIKSIEELTHYPTQQRRLLFCRIVMEGRVRLDTYRRVVKYDGFSFFIQKQKIVWKGGKRPYGWKGMGSLYMECEGYVANIDVKDKKAVSFIVNRIPPLKILNKFRRMSRFHGFPILDLDPTEKSMMFRMNDRFLELKYERGVLKVMIRDSDSTIVSLMPEPSKTAKKYSPLELKCSAPMMMWMRRRDEDVSTMHNVIMLDRSIPASWKQRLVKMAIADSSAATYAKLRVHTHAVAVAREDEIREEDFLRVEPKKYDPMKFMELEIDKQFLEDIKAEESDDEDAFTFDLDEMEDFSTLFDVVTSYRDLDPMFNCPITNDLRRRICRINITGIFRDQSESAASFVLSDFLMFYWRLYRYGKVGYQVAPKPEPKASKTRLKIKPF
jgi:hypothetical protein